MPPQIVASKVFVHLEQIVNELMHRLHDFPPPVRDRLATLYADMYARLAHAPDTRRQGLAVVAFVEALDALPEVRAALGPLLDQTKGFNTHGAADADTSVLGWLPPELGALLPATAGPPDDSGDFAFELRAEAPPPPATRAQPTPAAPTQPAPPAPAPLVRYPELEYPDEVVMGARTSLLVCLLREPLEPAAAPRALLVADTGTAELPVIEVVVRARGFDVEGSNTQMLEVTRDDDCELRFVLIPREEGPRSLRVDFYQNGRTIGTARREVVVVAQPDSESVPAAQPEPPLLEFASGAAPPADLEITVEVDRRDERVLYFTLHSTNEQVDYHHAQAGSVTLAGAPLEKMQAVYAELSRLAGRAPATPDEVAYQARRLGSLGNQLWEELFPAELKDAYWQWRDYVRALLITSDEPWIPWEIVKPFRFDDHNRRVDEPHLCERFTVARWLAGPGLCERLAIRHVRPVAPSAVDLASVQAELDYLEQINSLAAGVVPDTPYSDRGRVLDLIENGTFSVLHVAAHGSFDAALPDNSGIALDGGALRPSDIFARFGGARPRPLVFINACHGARAEFSLTGLGGWADKLVRQARVAAFVGAAWEVNDRLALLFAQTFYGALLRDGRSIGESLRLARTTIRDAEPSNSSWLAYVLYGDPEAHAELVPGSVPTEGIV